MSGSWRSTRLSGDHELSGFDCGVPDLNAWLWSHAVRAQDQGTARTTVWLPEDSDAVRAYYAIAPTQVLREEGLARGDAGGHTVIPGYLLARLALDRTLHGQGYGAELLYDALETIVHAADFAGGRLIVVDAIDERAAVFYQHHDFKPLRNNPLRLVMKIATAVEALGAGQPGS